MRLVGYIDPRLPSEYDSDLGGWKFEFHTRYEASGAIRRSPPSAKKFDGERGKSWIEHRWGDSPCGAHMSRTVDQQSIDGKSGFGMLRYVIRGSWSHKMQRRWIIEDG